MSKLNEIHTLLNRKIVGAFYDPEHEGSYILELDDGRTVTFGSSGDDMTFTSLSIEKK